ncbi:MAG: SCP2 sterol-binding domain-containing protein [Thermoleophilia bacterium]|nr:SCP2 sterol-binding domain-containing protein [Thermoleophilia bacterium]
MTDSAREFFEGLERRLDPARLVGQTVTYRFEVEGAGSWHVAIANGRATVTEAGGAADCVIRMKERTLLGLLSGETKATTAFMLGRIKVEGDLSLALRLEQLLS